MIKSLIPYLGSMPCVPICLALRRCLKIPQEHVQRDLHRTWHERRCWFTDSFLFLPGLDPSLSSVPFRPLSSGRSKWEQKALRIQKI